MKPNKSRILALVLVAVIIGGVMWWFSRKSADKTAATPQIVAAAKADAPKAAVAVNQVAPPTAAAVAAHGTPVSAAVPPSPEVLAAQAQLRARFKDAAQILRQQGFYAEELALVTPDFATEQLPEVVKVRLAADARNMQDPAFRAKIEVTAQRLDYLATLTPTLNATMDKATYYGNWPDKPPSPDGQPQKIDILVKINGQWYEKLDWGDE